MNFHKNLYVSCKMETQKIINLLNDSNSEESKFASQATQGKYDLNNSFKFEAESIKSSLSNYSDVFVLVTVDMTVNAGNGTNVTLKNCALFSTCKTEINDTFIDEANHIYIGMPMYNLTEYSDNYLDTSGSLWQFRRNKVSDNDVDLNFDNSELFKYKSVFVRKTANAASRNTFVKDTKIVVPLKYPSNFWRSLETPLINCKVHLELNWNEN